LIACSQPDRRAELAACQLISTSGAELARCLVMKYNWGADSAGPAKIAWQWELDSIRLEHEAQAQAVVAKQQEREARAYRAHVDSLRARVRLRADIEQDFRTCDSKAFAVMINGDTERSKQMRDQCRDNYRAALRKAGFPSPS